MKLSKKYKRQLKKKFLTALSSTTVLLMLIAFGKLAGISGILENSNSDLDASIASISSGESTLEDSSNSSEASTEAGSNSSLASSKNTSDSTTETSQTLAGGALQATEANSNNSSDSENSNSEISLASELSEENSVADEEGTSNASEDESSVASETESEVSNETESTEESESSAELAIISSVAEVANVGATRLENTSTTTYIYDAADLVIFRNNVNNGTTYSGKTVYLMADIDLSTVCSSSLGSWTPIGNSSYTFAGTFDGNYHTISNLYMSTSSSSYTYYGFFRYLTSTSVVQNLVLEDVYIYNSYSGAAVYVGGIVGYNYYGTIQNCGIESGSITAYHTTTYSSAVGGITGRNYYRYYIRLL